MTHHGVNEPQAHTTTGFLDMPLEVRVMIYDMLLSIEDNVYEIKHFPSTPIRAFWYRDNVHKVSDIGPHHLALTAVNKQIREDIKTNLPTKDFRFIGTEALLNFVFNKGTPHPRAVNVELLDKAAKVQVVLGSESSPHRFDIHWEPLKYMVWHLDKPLAVEFVTVEGSDDGVEVVCGKIACKWNSHMEYIKYKSAGRS